MPAVSGPQYRYFAGIAHGMKPRKGGGPSPEVAREMVEKTPPEKRRRFSRYKRKEEK